MIPLLLALIPELLIDTFPSRVVDAQKPFALQVHYANIAGVKATNVVVEINVANAEILKIPGSCTASGGAVRCAFAELPLGSGMIDLECSRPLRRR